MKTFIWVSIVSVAETCVDTRLTATPSSLHARNDVRSRPSAYRPASVFDVLFSLVERRTNKISLTRVFTVINNRLVCFAKSITFSAEETVNSFVL
jgi:hypothetical protein